MRKIIILLVVYALLLAFVCSQSSCKRAGSGSVVDTSLMERLLQKNDSIYDAEIKEMENRIVSRTVDSIKLLGIRRASVVTNSKQVYDKITVSPFSVQLLITDSLLSGHRQYQVTRD